MMASVPSPATPPADRADWAGVPVAVTGAGGFVGSHLVEALVGAGADVRAFVSYRAQRGLGALAWTPPEVRDAVDVRRGDLRDQEAVRRLVEDRDVVFHLGALVAIPYSYESPRSVFDVNVTGTLNVALAARDAGVRRLVHTSTSEVYGTPRHVPITEDHPVAAQSPYAASKAAADQLVVSFGHSYDLPFTIVRPFNTYGPRQSTRAVLPTIVTQALAGGPVRLGALTPRRDLTYVEDTVAGFLAAAAAPGARGRTLQLGTGTDHAVAAMVAAVGRALGRELVVEEDPARLRPVDSEVQRLLADPARMTALTGWTATRDLDEGIALLVDWHRTHPDAAGPGGYAV